MSATPLPQLPISHRLLTTGRAALTRWAPLVDRADPAGSVSPASRLLCAGLGHLAAATLASTHPAPSSALLREVADLAALLALLTKIDDQVIDDPGFHRRGALDEQACASRVRRYLAPTLVALRGGVVPAGTQQADLGRCTLAADLGRRLRRLGRGGTGLAQLMRWIERGWEVQAQAVAALSRPPGHADEQAINHLTREISGCWLLFIALVGAVPRGCRPLQPRETDAFLSWGGWIQRADALADLHKDVAEGLISSAPLVALATRERALVEQAWRGAPCAPIDAALVRHELDRAACPGTAELRRLDGALAGLGALPVLLRWIEGFLLQRYLDRPSCARAPEADFLQALLEPDQRWAAYQARMMSTCSAR